VSGFAKWGELGREEGGDSPFRGLEVDPALEPP